jgi:hypothetical protein
MSDQVTFYGCQRTVRKSMNDKTLKKKKKLFLVTFAQQRGGKHKPTCKRKG